MLIDRKINFINKVNLWRCNMTKFETWCGLVLYTKLTSKVVNEINTKYYFVCFLYHRVHTYV